jgi:hypothetical protein
LLSYVSQSFQLPVSKQSLVLNQANRKLKAIMPESKPAELKLFVQEWHRRALPVIATKAFDVTWDDFKTAWVNVQYTHPSVIAAAFAAAYSTPEPPIDGRTELGVLVAVCRELQRLASDKPFFLSCRSIAEFMGIGRMTASRWLKDLQFFRVLHPCDKGRLRDRQASTWRYIGKGHADATRATRERARSAQSKAGASEKGGSSGKCVVSA